MPLNRFMVNDVKKLGLLVKAWARGKDLPRNKKEFETHLTEFGITPTWPTGDNEIVNVIVERVPHGVLHLLVASSKLIDESEAYLRQPGAKYPLPDYYQLDAFHTEHKIADNVDFNDKRTGDYTISHCT